MLDEELYQLQVESLRKISECPICLGTLNPDTVFCISGHAVCRKCKEDSVRNCPTCRQPFTSTKSNFLFQQMLDVIRCDKYCQYCKKLFTSNQNHELYCSHRTTACKIGPCEWTGPGKEVFEHVERNHLHHLIIAGKNTKKSRENFCPGKYSQYLVLVSVSGHLFWQEAVNNPLTGILTITYHAVPSGESNSTFYASEIFKTEDDEYETKLKLNLDPDIDNYKKNSIAIPITMVENFINDKKLLEFETRITQVK